MLFCVLASSFSCFAHSDCLADELACIYISYIQSAMDANQPQWSITAAYFYVLLCSRHLISAVACTPGKLLQQVGCVGLLPASWMKLLHSCLQHAAAAPVWHSI